MVRYLKRDECRSVQLLSYFGEKDILPCGQCDVCKQYKAEPLNETTVEVISNEMNALLAEKDFRIHELVSAMREHNQESVMEILRWKADREEVLIDGDVVRLAK
jgi:ATP-dependent DNA helicase RecQ